MRGIAYVIAAVAALGIMFVIATMPGPQPQPAGTAASAT